MTYLLIGLGTVAGFATAGVLLGMLVMRVMWRTRRGGAFALASALLFSFGVVNGGAQDAVLESGHTAKRKKDPQPGDPPEPD